MPVILIQNLHNLKLDVSDEKLPLLKHFQDHYLDWMHACGGKGRCTTCKLKVLNGLQNFEPLTEAEQRFHRLGALAEDERLSCQARIFGDVIVCVPEES